MDEGQGLCLTLVQFAVLLKCLVPKTLLLGCELLCCCLSDCARQEPSRTPERRWVDLVAGMGRQGEYFVLFLLYFLWVSPCSSEHSYVIKTLCFHGRTFQLWHLLCLLCLQTFKSVFPDGQIFFFFSLLVIMKWRSPFFGHRGNKALGF